MLEVFTWFHDMAVCIKQEKCTLMYIDGLFIADRKNMGFQHHFSHLDQDMICELETMTSNLSISSALTNFDLDKIHCL